MCLMLYVATQSNLAPRTSPELSVEVRSFELLRRNTLCGNDHPHALRNDVIGFAFFVPPRSSAIMRKNTHGMI